MHGAALHEVFTASLATASPAPRGNAAWVAAARADDWMPWLEPAAALLSDAERSRVARKRRPQDREELVLCYALHRLLLAAWSGEDAAGLAVGRDADGRPLSGLDGVGTSLSHTRGAFALAIAGEGAVGIDIEAADNASGLEEIEGQVCHPLELQRLAGLVGADRHARLLQTWVRKEAYLKAAGVGLDWEMAGFVADPGARLPLLPTDPAGPCVRVQELDLLRPTHVVALAAAPDTRFRQMHLAPRPA